MVIKIIRWLKGYVLFTAIGKFPERFINLMNVNGIRYWNSKPCKGGFTAVMLLSDYLNIRRLAHRAKVRLKVQKRVGLPFFIKKYKRRKGILAGAVATVLILSVLSQFVWVIDIKGEEKLSESEIRPILASNGLYVGVQKNSVDGQKIERNTLLKLTDLRWMSVNLLNNVATVEIKEKEKKPKINKTYPCNIRASCDGVITKASVENGTSQVKVGSAVTKNQVLVNSVMTDGLEFVKYVHSQAEILADVQYSKVFQIQTNKEYLIPQEKYTTKSLANFLWLNFPLKLTSSLTGEKASVFNTYKLTVNNVQLPVGYKEEKSYYYIKETKKRNNKKILENKLALYEIFNESKSQIKSRKISFSQKENILIMNVSYTVNKDIAEIQKIQVKS